MIAQPRARFQSQSCVSLELMLSPASCSHASGHPSDPVLGSLANMKTALGESGRGNGVRCSEGLLGDGAASELGAGQHRK